MAIQASDISGLVATTLPELKRLKMTDLMSDYRNTIALSKVINPNKTTKSTGYVIRFNAITGTNGSARMVGLYSVDNPNVVDNQTYGEIPWRHTEWNYSMDKHEPAFNAEPARIVDLIKNRRITALGSGIELFERKIWRSPAVDNTIDPYGIQYWIVKSATPATLANANGFNGLTPAGWTTVGGISPTTYPRWANYADAYALVTDDDLVAKVRRAMTMTNFKKLVDETPTYDVGENVGLYTNYNVISKLENLLKASNENIGMDLAKYDGNVLLKGHEVVHVQELDSDPTDPIYGIDWRTFSAEVLKGFWMKETVVNGTAGQHLVETVFTDSTWNLLCTNRRKNWVISNGTAVLAA